MSIQNEQPQVPTLDMDAIKRGAEAARIAEEAPPKPKRLVNEIEPVGVRYVHRSGVLEGDIRIKAPNAQERQEIALAKVSLAAGRPIHLFAEVDQVRFDAIATVSILVVEAPAWFKENVLVDDSLLFPVFEKVVSHSERYFRGDDGEGEAQAGPPRVVFVDPLDG